MARTKNKLTAIAVKKAGNGKLDDGGGLRLYKTAESARWVYRYTFAGARREMGLGSSESLSLADARKERDRWAAWLTKGVDPITQRQREKDEAAAAASRSDPTFKLMTQIVFEAKKRGLRGEGKRGRWLSPLETHMFPKIGHRRLSTLNQHDIADAMRPIWHAKGATARKAYQRTMLIFRQAKLSGHDADPFTVEAAGHILGEVNHEVEHIKATPWQEIPELYRKLDRPFASYQCLRLIILTAARSESARGARMSEIDGDVWTIPADRMKGKVGKVRDFRVPLSPAAIEVVRAANSKSTGDLLFSSYRSGYISSTAIAKALNELGEPGRPHGFRTSFRTWVQETEPATFDVAETALAHRVGNDVERSYARSDLLDQRRVLMNKWADFVTGQSSKIIRLRGEH